MLLKKIHIINFRQFEDETVVFATDKDKNVTVIKGENGSGKTTLSRAIRWCLYGENDFNDKMLFNKGVAANMMIGDSNSVIVTLILEHQGIEYILKTEQLYKKSGSSKLVPNNIRRSITKKVDGQTIDIESTKNDSVINSILPSELSRYFFFDGERMEAMRKEIVAGRSKNFADAVNGLLGLNAIINAIEHLKPTSRYSVIGAYNNSYDPRSNSRILEYTREIEKIQQQIDDKSHMIDNLDETIKSTESRIEELKIRISKSSEGMNLQNEKDKKERDIKNLRLNIERNIEAIISSFNRSCQGYFSSYMVKKALDLISKEDMIDKGIPSINDKTINYLINKKRCICGTEIIPGNDAYIALSDLYKYVPPKAIGTLISEFAKECEQRYKSGSTLMSNLLPLFAVMSSCKEDIEQKQDDIKEIERKLAKYEDTSSFQTEVEQLLKILNDDKAKRDGYTKDIGRLETQRDRQDTERSKLSLQDDKNRKIEEYKAYAQYMYDTLTSMYNEKEKEVRNKLQDTINEIFNSIFDGTMKLSLDEKYNVTVWDTEMDEFNNDIETSEAQSISVIFAFIAGIIKLAKENQNGGDDVLSTEPYPLVMDAPLSTFDKKRISIVCNTLPKIAEQVIIFIKDTDGDIAEEYMSDFIGQRNEFVKNSTFKTEIR